MKRSVVALLVSCGLALPLSAATSNLVFQGTLTLPKVAAAANLTVCLEHHEGRSETPPATFIQQQPLDAHGAFRMEAAGGKQAYTLYIRDNTGRVLIGYPHLDRSRNFGVITQSLDGEITGTVFLPDGAPCTGATVQLERRLESGCSHFLDSGAARADNGGAFIFNGLNTGRYRLRVKSEAYTHPPLEVELAGDLNYSEIHLAKAFSLSGRVKRADGAPVSGIQVHADRQPPVTTDAEGRYRFGGLGPETYSVTAWSDALAMENQSELEVKVQDADAVAPDIILAPVGSLRLAIKTEPPGRSLPEKLAISLNPKNSRGRYRQYDAPVENGTARFDKLAPGSYRLNVTDDTLGDVEATVTVESGKETGASITLPEVFSMPGQVFDEAGKPVSDARVMLIVTKGKKGMSRSESIKHESTDEDGRFVVSGLKRGEATLLIQAEKLAPLRESFTITNNLPERRFTLSKGLTVTGRLVDDQGNPVADAEITLAPDRTDRENDPFSWTTRSEEIKSGADGTFRLSGVVDGKYTIQVKAENHYGDLPPIQVASNALNLGNLTLKKGLVIAGNLSESDGKPISGMKVQVSGFPTVSRGANTHVSQDAETEADGAFRVGGLPEGKYTVSIRDPDSYEELTELEDVKAGTDDLIVCLGQKCSILVKVFGPDGKPVAGAEIGIGKTSPRTSFYSSSRSDEKKTDAAGQFRMELRQGARYTVTAQKKPWLKQAQEVNLSGSNQPPAELVLKLDTGRTVTGAVVDADGKPRAGVYVSLGDLDAVKTDAEGRFQLEGVASGLASLTVHADEEREKLLATQRLLISSETQQEALRIELGRSGIVTGTVRDAAGEPVPDAMVFMQNTERLIGHRQGYQGKTEENGQFRFEQVVPGDYMLMAAIPDAEESMPQMRQIRVEADKTVTADFPVETPTGSKLVGLVTLAGKPVTNVQVTLMPFESKNDEMAMARMMLNRKPAKTDNAGRFEIENVSAGPNLLFINNASPRYSREEEPGIQYNARIDLAAGQTNLTVDIAGQTLKGIVEDASGKPLAGASLTLEPANMPLELRSMLGRRSRSDKDGRFTFLYLAPDLCRITAHTEEGDQIARVELKPDDGTTEHRIRLQPGLRLSGTVTRDIGDDSAYAWIMAFSEEGEPVGGESIGEDGAYDFSPRLPPGRYHLACIQSDMSVEVVPIDLKTDATQNFTLKPAGSIQVALRGDKAKIAGRIVRVADAQGREIVRLRAPSLSGMMGRMFGGVSLSPTDKEGRATIQGLAPGDYTVRVEGSTASAKTAVTALKIATVELTVTD